MRADEQQQVGQSRRRAPDPGWPKDQPGHTEAKHDERTAARQRRRGSEQPFETGCSGGVRQRLGWAVVIANQLIKVDPERALDRWVGQIEHLQIHVDRADASQHFERIDAFIHEVAKQLRPRGLRLGPRRTRLQGRQSGGIARRCQPDQRRIRPAVLAIPDARIGPSVAGREARRLRQPGTSNVGAVSKRGRCPANLLDVPVLQQLDGSTPAQKPVPGVQPLPHPTRCQAVREHQHDVSQFGQTVVALRADAAGLPTPHRSVRDSGRGGDVRLGHAVRFQGPNDLGCLDRTL